MLLGVSRRTTATSQAGRPRTLEAKDWRRLQVDLRKTPRDFGLAATLWDGPVLSEHLRRRYGVDLGVRQCQRLFRQMGFRLRKPRRNTLFGPG
jgi:transposase